MDYRTVFRNRTNSDVIKNLYYAALEQGIITELKYDQKYVDNIKEFCSWKLMYYNFYDAVIDFKCSDEKLRYEFILAYPYAFKIFE